MTARGRESGACGGTTRLQRGRERAFCEFRRFARKFKVIKTAVSLVKTVDERPRIGRQSGYADSRDTADIAREPDHDSGRHPPRGAADRSCVARACGPNFRERLSCQDRGDSEPWHRGKSRPIRTVSSGPRRPSRRRSRGFRRRLRGWRWKCDASVRRPSGGRYRKGRT